MSQVPVLKRSLAYKVSCSGVCQTCLLNLKRGQKLISAGCDSARQYSIPLSDQMTNSQLASFPEGGTMTREVPGKKWIFQG